MSMALRPRWTRSRRALAATAGLAAALAVGGVVTASPASADTNCELGYHCVFYLGYDSARHLYYNSDPNFTNDQFDNVRYGTSGQNQYVNDNIYSASNHTSTSYYSRYYLNINYTGGMLFCVKPGSEIEDLAAAVPSSSLSLTTSNPGGCY
ncbi:hypothetical protein [Streptomyces hyaluromycini]|uniref:hypothetical protein n=1 Tax=Streptomyces hyaluromycini TaxID=1377993 RepID=UPI0011AE21DC|nr:hypothetical protein [Streptomyces hyaluromycini]